MTDVKNLRPDWRIARHLSKTRGLVAARDWLSVPFVDLTDRELFVSTDPDDPIDHWIDAPFLDAIYSGLEPSSGSVFVVRVTQLTADSIVIDDKTGKVMHDCKYWVPVPEACFCFVKSHESVDGHSELAIGYAHGAEIDGANREFADFHPSFDDTARGKGGQVVMPGNLLLQVYARPTDPEHDHGGEFTWLAVIPIEFENVDTGSPDMHVRMASTIWNSDFREPDQIEPLVQRASTVVDGVFRELYETDDHFVEIKTVRRIENEKKRKKAAKTQRNFPWLDETLPRIVLIDPTKLNGRREPQGGTHASPRPHQRRGHWRTYRSPKFKNVRGQRKRVKPAWIGDREWIHRGSLYKVVEAEKPNQ